MRHLFSKDNFIRSTFEGKQKGQSFLVSFFVVIFFALASYTFFFALYSFANSVGAIVSGSPDVAIKDFIRGAPIFLICFMSIWGLLFYHGLFRNVSDEKRHKSLVKNSIALLVFAILNGGAVAALLVLGRYHSLIEGSPTPFFPLDTLIYSAIYVFLAIFGLIYAKKDKANHIYVVPSRGPIVRKVRGLYCTFMTFWMLISFYSFAGLTLGGFIYDFSNNNLYFGIGYLVVCFVNVLFIFMWEFYYNNLTEESRKALLLPLSLLGLLFALLAAGAYGALLTMNMDAPSNGGFGILPVAFAASVNIATLLVVATPLIVSVVALIKGLIIRKK